MNTQTETIKVCLDKSVNGTLYPQIVEFVIWKTKTKYEIIKIQGLQSVYGGMAHFNWNGTIQFHVRLGETLEFQFGGILESDWVTAEIQSSL